MQDLDWFVYIILNLWKTKYIFTFKIARVKVKGFNKSCQRRYVWPNKTAYHQDITIWKKIKMQKNVQVALQCT